LGTTEEIKERPVWEVLSLSIIGMVIGMFIGGFIGLLVAGLVSGNGLTLVANQSFSKTDLLIIQGFTSTFGLLVFPFIAYSKICRISPNTFFKGGVTPISILSLLFIVISFSIGLSVIIEWNQNIHFPEFLKSFEEWARLKEDDLAVLMKDLTQFDSFGYFALGLFVIGVVAAVTEEYLFRGILQTQILRWTKNQHAAIWITAILFSAFHVQFFGFVPRVLLGALFGYLYVWSGNLMIPIAAHFINNGSQVILLYLSQKGIITIDMESTEAAPWSAVIIATALFIALLYYFKKYHQSINQTTA
jgi:membrane protease YdiL (CAAX protease family)